MAKDFNKLADALMSAEGKYKWTSTYYAIKEGNDIFACAIGAAALELGGKMESTVLWDERGVIYRETGIDLDRDLYSCPITDRWLEQGEEHCLAVILGNWDAAQPPRSEIAAWLRTLGETND